MLDQYFPRHKCGAARRDRTTLFGDEENKMSKQRSQSIKEQTTTSIGFTQHDALHTLPTKGKPMVLVIGGVASFAVHGRKFVSGCEMTQLIPDARRATMMAAAFGVAEIVGWGTSNLPCQISSPDVVGIITTCSLGYRCFAPTHSTFFSVFADTSCARPQFHCLH